MNECCMFSSNITMLECRFFLDGFGILVCASRLFLRSIFVWTISQVINSSILLVITQRNWHGAFTQISDHDHTIRTHHRYWRGHLRNCWRSDESDQQMEEWRGGAAGHEWYTEQYANADAEKNGREGVCCLRSACNWDEENEVRRMVSRACECSSAWKSQQHRLRSSELRLYRTRTSNLALCPTSASPTSKLETPSHRRWYWSDLQNSSIGSSVPSSDI